MVIISSILIAGLAYSNRSLYWLLWPTLFFLSIAATGSIH